MKKEQKKFQFFFEECRNFLKEDGNFFLTDKNLMNLINVKLFLKLLKS